MDESLRFVQLLYFAAILVYNEILSSRLRSFYHPLQYEQPKSMHTQNTPLTGPPS